MSNYVIFDELIDKNGIFYFKNDKEPYSGHVKGNYSGYMKKGLPSGVWEEYSNDVLISKSTYNKGGLDLLNEKKRKTKRSMQPLFESSK